MAAEDVGGGCYQVQLPAATAQQAHVEVVNVYEVVGSPTGDEIPEADHALDRALDERGWGISRWALKPRAWAQDGGGERQGKARADVSKRQVKHGRVPRPDALRM